MRRVDVARLVAKLGIVAERERDELRAPCPNPAHDDRSPSWSINARTGAHHCWSCGFGGGAGDLVAALIGARLAWDAEDGWHWIEQAGLLIGDAEVALSAELVLLATAARPALTLPALTSGLGVSLGDWPTPVRRYVESRGITREQVASWGIGYATGGRAAGRIVIPVADGAGRLLSWTARAYDGRQPPYLTPRKEDGPDPGAVFGEAFWPDVGARRVLVVCEGAMDALAIERAVGLPVAGLLGATRARAPEQVAKIATFAHVLVLTDPDTAGEAAWQQLRALGRHCRVERVRFGPGEDAASVSPETVRAVLRFA